MATGFHAKGSGAQNTGLASFSVTCTISTGDAVVVFGSWDSASTTTPTVATTGGTGSDSFTLVYGPISSGAFKAGAWLLQSAGTGRTGATVSWASSNPAFADAGCDSFTGQTASVLDQVAFATGAATGAITSGNTPTLTSSDEFAIGYASSGGNITAAGGSWTDDGIITLNASWIEHRVLAATTAIQSTFSNNNGTWISFALTFKAGSAAAAPFSLNNWPVPGRRVQPLLDGIFPTSSLLRLVGAPGRQTDWPVPRGPKGLIADQLGFIDPSETWLIGRDRFFGAPGQPPAYHWPNPVRSKTWAPDQLGYLDPSETWLIGQDVVYGLPGQVPDYDWPNPVGSRVRAPSVDLKTFTEGLTYLIGQDTFFGAPGEVPAFDWPNPVISKPSHVSYRGLFEAYKINLLVTLTPFTQLDWPLPGRSRAADLRSFTESAAIHLIGQDQFFGAPGQVPSFDWPNPQRPRSSPSAYGWLDPYKVNLFFVLSPFAQLDWPNPQRGATPPISLKTIATGSAYLIGQDVFFAAPGVGPNYDWPNPQRGRQPSTDLKTFTLSAAIQLVGLDRFFGAPGEVPAFDWPNPVRSKPAPASYAGFADNYKIGLFQIVFVPFAQTDWPNPVRARNPAVDQIGYIDPSEVWLIGQDRFFGAAGEVQSFDWPNPVRARPAPASYSGHIDNYRLGLFQVVFAPFAQLDWPNPVRAKASVASYAGFADAFKLNLFQIFSPFYQNDWPNPRGFARNISQSGFSDPYKIGLFAFPFSQADWPVPRGPTRTMAHVGWADSYKTNLFVSAAVVPFYQTDWPNPVLPRRVQQPTSFAKPFNLLLLALQAGRYARQIIGQAFQATIIGKPDTRAVVALASAKTIVGSSLMAVHDPFDFVCGDSWEITGPLNDANGVPLNLVGATLTWKLDSVDGLTNYLTLSLGSGITILNLAAATVLVKTTNTQTAALLPGNYIDSLRVTLQSGEVFTESSGLIRAGHNPT